MHLDLSDREAAALTTELADATGNDRYPFWEPIRALKAILGNLGPVRELQPPPKVYVPPKGRRSLAACRTGV
jgi:hypothetical protein